jgi:hypothetical protein
MELPKNFDEDLLETFAESQSNEKLVLNVQRVSTQSVTVTLHWKLWLCFQITNTTLLLAP